MFRYWLFSLACFSIIVSLCGVKKHKSHSTHRTKDVVDDVTIYIADVLDKYTNLDEANLTSSMLGDLTSKLNQTYGKGNVRGKVIGIESVVTIFKHIIEKFGLVPDYRKMSYQSYEKGLTSMLCNGCEVFIGISIFLLRDVVSDQTLKEAYILICSIFKSKDFCEGLLSLQIPYIFYILQNRPVNQNQICAISLQWLGCKGKVPKWNIKLDGKEQPDKPKGEYSGETMKILQITDIHFDPLYKVGSPANCQKKSICCQGDSIVQDDHDLRPAGYWAESSNCDINLHFLETTLKHIADTHDDISYIYFTGDIITHRIWDTTVSNNTDVINQIHGVMKDILPNVPIFSILGNHEPHPLNIYTPEQMDIADFEATWLFELYADIILTLLPAFNGDVNTILKGGYYSHLVEPGFRIIGINSNPAYTLNWWLVYDSTDPYGQLQWLKRVLHKAEANNEAVHILSHVPCNDSFSFVVWCRQFKRIISRYSNTIMSIFSGHTHVDEMMIYHSEENPRKPVTIGWNGGSITPYDRNNPNYRIYEVDSMSYEVMDYTDYYVNLETANNDENNLVWQKLYSFKEEYNMQNLTPYGMRDLVERMAKNKELVKKYLRNRMKGAPLESPCKKNCRKRILCSFLRGDFHDTRQCKQVLSHKKDIFEEIFG